MSEIEGWLSCKSCWKMHRRLLEGPKTVVGRSPMGSVMVDRRVQKGCGKVTYRLYNGPTRLSEGHI